MTTKTISVQRPDGITVTATVSGPNPERVLADAGYVEVTVSGPDAERVLAKEVTRHGDE